MSKGVYHLTAPTLNDGGDQELQLDSLGNLKSILAGYTAIGDGRKVVAAAGTAEALATSTACKRVIIMAETNNTGVITVGGSTVVAALATRQGIPLNAGDSVTITIDNLSKIYLDTTVNGDGVTYYYLT